MSDYPEPRPALPLPIFNQRNWPQVEGTGINGVQGPQGVAGTGINGVQGPQGVAGTGGGGTGGGLQGPQGLQGVAGGSGSGFQGPQGNQGIVGGGGFQGNQGIVGGGITTTNYTPTLVSGANLTALAGAEGAYGSFGSKKMAWGSGTWRWANASTTGGGIGNTPSISFPPGYFTTVQQFIVSVSEVGGEAIQLVTGDLSGLNTVGNFWAYRPVSSGSGISYFFTMSFLAIGV
jgi:hypothetical protein